MAKVLSTSTIIRGLVALTSLAMASMSLQASMGLVGVSNKKARASGCFLSTASTALRSDVSTSTVVMPKRLSTF